MYKVLGFMILVCLLMLGGCKNEAAYKNDKVAAIVRNEEITIGDLRLLYPDDVISKKIEGVVKAKLAEQEVKQMNMDNSVAKQIKEIEESYGEYPKREGRSAKAQSIRAFADPQAEKLGMNAASYYKKYTNKSVEMTAYINTYASAILGEMGSDETGIEEYNHHANELLDDLVEKNKNAIEIFIKNDKVDVSH